MILMETDKDTECVDASYTSWAQCIPELRIKELTKSQSPRQPVSLLFYVQKL